MALLRLVWLYLCLCALLLAAGLLHRFDLEAGRPQQTAPPQSDLAGLPFAGVNIDLAAYTPEARGHALSELTAAGFGWVRQRFDWGLLEPAPGVYAWDEADAWIEAIAAADLVPVAVLDGSPVWARAEQDLPPTDNPFAPPANPTDLARFARAFAERYSDRVRFYQVWDEPNIAPHWGNRLIEPVAYAQMLKVTAAALRAADPDAVVVAAALAPTGDRGHTAIDEVYYWRRMVAAGAADAADVLAIQPFGFGHSPDYPRQSIPVLDFRRAALLQRALAAMGWGDKPIWAVRSGWNRLPNALWGTVRPEDQARYAVAAYELAWREWPWLAALGWAVARPSVPENDPVWGFALHTPSGAAAPVLLRLQEWLAAHRSGVRPLSQASPADFIRWLFPWLLVTGGLLLVAWRSIAAARLLSWSTWIAGWQRLPWPFQVLGWMGLLWLYYIAVWPPLIGLCWLLWSLLCLTQPRYGLALAALLLPFYYQHKELSLVDGTIAVPPAAAALLCLLPALALHTWRSRFRLAPIDAAVLMLLGISLLTGTHVWQWQAWGQGMLDLVLIPLGLWFALRILVWADATSQRSVLLVVLALFGGGALAALWGLQAWLHASGVQVDGVLRLVGPHFSPNHTALYLLRTFFLGVGLAAGYWATRPVLGRDRRGAGLAVGIGLWAAVAIVLLALVLTGSRGALLLGLPVGFLIVGWTALRRWPGLLHWLATHPAARWLAGAGLVIVGAAVVLLWDRLLNRHTLSLRIDLWEASLRLWHDYLLLGVGPGGFFWRYPAFLPLGATIEPNQLHPHNVWLELATTWGLLGFAWIGILVWQSVAIWQHRWSSPISGWLSAGLLAALLAAFAHAQMDAFFLLPDLAAWNLLALALAATVEER